MNYTSVVKIQTDSAKYGFKTIWNTKINGWNGTYKGMFNKTSGLPSGFGRFYDDAFVIDGQFYQGKFHG